MRRVVDTRGDRVEPFGGAEVGGEHLDAGNRSASSLRAVRAPSDHHRRDAGGAEQLHHRLADPAGRAGDERGSERKRGRHAPQATPGASGPRRELESVRGLRGAGEAAGGVEAGVGTAERGPASASCSLRERLLGRFLGLQRTRRGRSCSPSSAVSLRMLTVLPLTCTKPPCTATSSTLPSASVMRVWFSMSAPRNGAWPGRNAISPPPRVRVMTCVASPEKMTFSGDTSSTCMVAMVRLRLLAAPWPWPAPARHHRR